MIDYDTMRHWLIKKLAQTLYECIRHEREDAWAMDDWHAAEREIDRRGSAYIEWVRFIAEKGSPWNIALAFTDEQVTDDESFFRKFPQLIWEHCWQSSQFRSSLPRPPYGRINFF